MSKKRAPWYLKRERKRMLSRWTGSDSPQVFYLAIPGFGNSGRRGAKLYGLRVRWCVCSKRQETQVELPGDTNLKYFL